MESIYHTNIIEIHIEFVANLTDVTEDILTHIKSKYEKTWNKKYGFILNVNKIVELLSNRISIYNGNIIVNCLIEIQHLLPEKNNIIPFSKVNIQQSFPQGMIVSLEDVMKIFIPNEFVISNPESIMIMDIRFQKGKFDCIGKLI